jgi:hypothetical protein
MANERLSMRKIKEVLRLHFEHPHIDWGHHYWGHFICAKIVYHHQNINEDVLQFLHVP